DRMLVLNLDSLRACCLFSPHPLSLLSSYRAVPRPDLHSFPTRRSSDLPLAADERRDRRGIDHAGPCCGNGGRRTACQSAVSAARDRKSTRLNSSHGSISYAVFCLKKKKKKKITHHKSKRTIISPATRT